MGISLWLLILAAPAVPAASTLSDETAPVAITLMECVETALQQNLGLATRRYEIRIAGTGVDIERAVFDPAVDLSSLYRKTDRQAATAERLLTFNPSFALDPQEEVVSTGAGIQTYLPTGTTLRAEASTNRVRSNRVDLLSEASGGRSITDYFTEMRFTIAQSLLRGAGIDTNLTGLRVQRLAAQQSRDAFARDVLATIANTERAYWQLVLLQDELDNALLSQELALDLLRRNQQKVEAGTLPPLEVLVAEAEVAMRREAVIKARTALRNGQDSLCRLLGLPNEDPRWTRGLAPSESPRYEPIDLDTERCVSVALENRPELAAVQRQIQAADLSEKHARNQLLPDLSLYGSAALSGEEKGSPDSSLDTMVSGDYTDYEVGAQFRYAIQNRSARARLRAASARLGQVLAAHKDLIQQVRVEIRTAVRDVAAARERIDAASTTVRLQRERLRLQEQAHEVGVSTSRDVLEAQDDLVEANVRLSNALVSYVNALVTLEERKGTLLQAHHIEIEDESSR